jgi:hypothetical protein
MFRISPVLTKKNKLLFYIYRKREKIAERSTVKTVGLGGGLVRRFAWNLMTH